jgi:hypothetical protein
MVDSCLLCACILQLVVHLSVFLVYVGAAIALKSWSLLVP